MVRDWYWCWVVSWPLLAGLPVLNSRDAFLFSLQCHTYRLGSCQDEYQEWIRKKCCAGSAVFISSNGPVFGVGNDLYIASNANTDAYSCAEIGDYY